MLSRFFTFLNLLFNFTNFIVNKSDRTLDLIKQRNLSDGVFIFSEWHIYRRIL